MSRASCSFVGLIFTLAVPGVVWADLRKPEQARLAVIHEGSAQFAGDTVFKDWLIRLPGHINPRLGSEVVVALRTQPALLSLVSEIEVLVNQQTVGRVSLDGKNPVEATNGPLRVAAAVPGRALQAGGNRLRLHFLFRKTALSNQDVLKGSSWAFEPAGSFFSLVYERAELFPELRRFPESVAEEKLLHSESPNSPVLTLLLPARRRDAHLRACAVIGARLGQLGYLSERDCRLAGIENWKTEMEARSGIIIGLRNELTSMALPAQIAARLEGLGAGEGLLAEFIVGQSPAQRRWVLVSGWDEAGLERACLTLGHASALASVPSNPAVIGSEPVLEAVQPAAAPVSLLTQLQGFLTSAAMRITGGTQSSESKGAVSSNAPVAWASMAGLQQLHHTLISDGALHKTAFLIPKAAALEELRLVFDLALYLGSQLPGSPVLWPEACSFSRASPPTQARLQNRVVLLLAPVAEWKNAFPEGTPLALEVPRDKISSVRIQGRDYKSTAFEPALGFVHLLTSPWSKGDLVLAAGGWQELSAAAVKGLIQTAAPAGKLAGNLCAMDAAGRTAVYDTRQAKLESFAEILQKNIPEGLTPEETQRKGEAEKLRGGRSASLNRMISRVAGAWLLLLVGARLALLWDREWRRKRAFRNEKLLPKTT